MFIIFENRFIFLFLLGSEYLIDVYTSVVFQRKIFSFLVRYHII